jgi:membrane-associated protein
MQQLIDHILNLNLYLAALVNDVGAWSYLILFLIIFAETGLVVTPFLPGDSLLFAAGSLASISSLDPHILTICLMIAAILGNTTNYAIGAWVGPKVFHFPKSRWFNPEHLQRTHTFFQKYGGRSLVLARFIPVLRTFAPFVAGIGRMNWWRFQLFNFIGSVAWVAVIIYLGYFFGSRPFVQDNFGILILIMIGFSVVPPIVGYIRHKMTP